MKAEPETRDSDATGSGPEGLAPGMIRHLKHNLDLKAEKHIRVHGGYQWDLFQDNETATPKEELFQKRKVA